MKLLSFSAVVVLAWFAYSRMNAPLTYPAGVLIAKDPVQSDATPNDVAFDSGKFHLTPLAHFELDARVLHRKIYRYDRFASQCKSLRVGELIHLRGLLWKRP